jgi:hypothetical protein
VGFYCGTFAPSVTRFNPVPVEPGDGTDVIRRVAMDSEQAQVGLRVGNERYPKPAFFAYTFPKPDDLEHTRIAPAAARWNADLGECVLEDEDVRGSDDPGARGPGVRQQHLRGRRRPVRLEILLARAGDLERLHAHGHAAVAKVDVGVMVRRFGQPADRVSQRDASANDPVRWCAAAPLQNGGTHLSSTPSASWSPDGAAPDRGAGRSSRSPLEAAPDLARSIRAQGPPRLTSIRPVP